MSERAEALRWAADVVHSEARWQWELHRRGGTGAQIVAQRMGIVENVLRGAAESAFLAEEKWRARNVPRLPQMRVQLERAEAEYERRTRSPITDRAAVGGKTHASIDRARLAPLSDTNVARVVELQRIIANLKRDIARAERPRR